MQTLQTSRGPITIRSTCAADADALRALRLESLALHPTAFGAAPEEDAAKDWPACAKSGSGDGLEAIFVADTGTELVGLTGIVASPRPKFPHSAFIWGVYVRQSHRGLRLSDTLLNAALNWA